MIKFAGDYNIIGSIIVLDRRVEMKEAYSLTEGPIASTLLKLTLPIIATNFISTTYGLIDMIWVGRLGSGPVAAIGTASFFINLALALSTMITIGTGIKVAHSVGKGEESRALIYIKNGFIMSLLLSILYTIVILFTKNKLIGFFELANEEIERMAIQFLVISLFGSIFTIINTLFSTILNSYGNSKQPFKIFTLGFLVNMLIDPLLIFGLGPIPGMGVLGAAIATLIANLVVTGLFILRTKNTSLFSLRQKSDIQLMKEVIKLGAPITIQRVTFIIISIIIAKLIVQWGAEAIAVQKVGIQIEAISYMTIGGLQGAIAAFFGQNYGARRLDRIHRGYYQALLLTVIFGALISVIFILFPGQLFSLFLSEASSLALGTNYMRIIGYSQLFMCLEIMSVGAFNGIGKTHVPPMFSITLTALRIPMALALSGPFGLNGIWMSIALSSVLKGVILSGWFIGSLRKLDRTAAVSSNHAAM